MNKVLSLLLILSVLLLLLSGCSGNKAVPTEAVSTTEITTETITEESKDLVDYLPTGLEAKEILVKYCEEHGYSFDNWNVVSDTQTDYQSLKPGDSEGGIIAQKNKLIFNLGKTSGNNAVIMTIDSDSLLSIQIARDSSLDAYEIIKLLFVDCPEQLMPPVAELKEKTVQAPNKYIDIEKGGLYFRATYWPSVTQDVISVYLQAPGGWNG